MATNRGKIHGGKSVLNVHVASDEFGEITRGETTRFYCTPCFIKKRNRQY